MNLFRVWLHSLRHFFGMQHQWWTYQERDERGHWHKYHFCRCGFESPFLEPASQVLDRLESRA